MYPEPRVTDFVSKNFIPVRLHVKTHPEAMGRFGADWTPTVMLLDSNGQARYDAVRAHTEHRVLVHGRRTVVFD